MEELQSVLAETVEYINVITEALKNPEFVEKFGEALKVS